MNSSDLLKYILDTVTNAETRLTPQRLIKGTSRIHGIPPAKVKAAIRTLLDNGAISYTYVFGATCIEPSFAKPVRITDHFILSPPGFPPTGEKETIEIRIRPGISFGSGRHPTTRLCLRAMEHALITNGLLPPRKEPHQAVDVGTGSGVLAIAAVRAGISSCLALDTDPVAAAEAEHNVALNRLTRHITVSCKELDAAPSVPLSLVCANLRYPTLRSLADLFVRTTGKGALLIFSGIRPEESAPLTALYESKGFYNVWQAQEKNWAGMVLIKS